MAKAGEKTIEAEKGVSGSVTAEPVVASQVPNGLRRTLGAAHSRTGTQGASDNEHPFPLESTRQFGGERRLIPAELSLIAAGRQPP
jgi:hypothetical protein